MFIFIVHVFKGFVPICKLLIFTLTFICQLSLHTSNLQCGNAPFNKFNYGNHITGW